MTDEEYNDLPGFNKKQMDQIRQAVRDVLDDAYMDVKIDGKPK